MTEEEVIKRRDEAIRRALNTPPSPLKSKPKKHPKPFLAGSTQAKPKYP